MHARKYGRVTSVRKILRSGKKLSVPLLLARSFHKGELRIYTYIYNVLNDGKIAGENRKAATLRVFKVLDITILRITQDVLLKETYSNDHILKI